MRITATTLAGLAIFFGLANAQSAYDNTCNPPPTGEQDVVTEPGVMATYGCGKFHLQKDYANDKRSTVTPEDCAAECSMRTPGGPCTWHSGTCYFYQAGGGTVDWNDAVTIETRVDVDKLCAANKACRTQNAALTKEKDDCLKQNQGPPAPQLPDGPTEGTCVHGEKFTMNGKNYEMACGHAVHGWATSTADGQQASVPTSSRKECVERCSRSSNCKIAVFFKKNGGVGNCWAKQVLSGNTPRGAIRPESNHDLAFEI